MAEWTWRTLGDLGVIIGGGTPKTTVPEHFGDDVPWITPRDLSRHSGRTIGRGERGITRLGLASSSARIVPPGSVIISSRAPIGLVAVAARELATNQGCRTIVPDPEVVNSDFLYYRLIDMREELEARGTGSTFPEISGSVLAKTPVLIPNLREQRAIAATLGALDDKIAANTRLAATADELAQSILRSSLDGTVAPLSEVAQLVMGSSPPGDTYNDSGIGVAFFQGVRDFGVRTPTRRIWTTSPTRLAEKGDILLSVRAPVGRTNFASETSCIGRGVAAVRAKNGHQKTLFHSLRAAPEVWSPFEAEGTVFGSVTRSQLERILVPVVAGSEVDRVEFTLASIEGRVEAALEENMTLAATRDALLPALMSGKLRVRDAQSIVGDLA